MRRRFRVGLCAGNLGNLMQHWVLCETLNRLNSLAFQSLHMVCTHSMAPWSVPRRPNADFDEVRMRLTANCTDVYEKVWIDLSANNGLPYPSSALFATRAWTKKL